MNIELSKELLNKFKTKMYQLLGENSEDLVLCNEINKFIKNVESNNLSIDVPKSHLYIGNISYAGELLTFKYEDLEEFLGNKYNKKHNLKQ